jgi:hypothetical protein
VWRKYSQEVKERYLPIDRVALDSGRSIADPKELSGDVILAAQALQVNAVVATENVSHLSLFLNAKFWRDIFVK